MIKIDKVFVLVHPLWFDFNVIRIEEGFASLMYEYRRSLGIFDSDFNISKLYKAFNGRYGGFIRMGERDGALFIFAAPKFKNTLVPNPYSHYKRVGELRAVNVFLQWIKNRAKDKILCQMIEALPERERLKIVEAIHDEVALTKLSESARVQSVAFLRLLAFTKKTFERRGIFLRIGADETVDFKLVEELALARGYEITSSPRIVLAGEMLNYCVQSNAQKAVDFLSQRGSGFEGQSVVLRVVDHMKDFYEAPVTIYRGASDYLTGYDKNRLRRGGVREVCYEVVED